MRRVLKPLKDLKPGDKLTKRTGEKVYTLGDPNKSYASGHGGGHLRTGGRSVVLLDDRGLAHHYKRDAVVLHVEDDLKLTIAMGTPKGPGLMEQCNEYMEALREMKAEQAREVCPDLFKPKEMVVMGEEIGYVFNDRGGDYLFVIDSDDLVCAWPRHLTTKAPTFKPGDRVVDEKGQEGVVYRDRGRPYVWVKLPGQLTHTGWKRANVKKVERKFKEGDRVNYGDAGYFWVIRQEGPNVLAYDVGRDQNWCKTLLASHCEPAPLFESVNVGDRTYSISRDQVGTVKNIKYANGEMRVTVKFDNVATPHHITVCELDHYRKNYVAT